MAKWHWIGQLEIGSGGQLLTTGTGDPEGAVIAPIGSIYLRVDGGVDTAVYFKEAGTGNAGWTAAGSGGGGGSTSLSTLTDVDLGILVTGDQLTWNGTKWDNEAFSQGVGNLNDVVFSTLVAGQILTYDGADWVNADSITFSSGVVGGSFSNPSSTAGLFIDSSDNVSDGWVIQADTGNINFQGGASIGGIVLVAAGGNSVTVSGGPLHCPVVINTQIASYQAAIADADQLIAMNVAGANNFTIPAHATVAFPVGTTLSVLQQGAGQVTLVAPGGVTLHNPSSNTTRAQWSVVSVVQISQDVWVASGDLT